MRIMVLGLRGFPGVEGGVEKHAEQLYPLLVELGFEVKVLTRSPYVKKKITHFEESASSVYGHLKINE